MAKKRGSPKKKTSSPPPSSAAEKFFYEHGGYSYDPKKETKEQGHRSTARAMAKAEEIAERLEWQFTWEEDPEPYEMGDAETEMPAEVLTCLLRDENGNVIASLGGIGMSGNHRQDKEYGRVVEAELALEAAHEKGLI